MPRHHDTANPRIILFGIVVIAFAVRLVHLWTISQGAWIDRYLTATSGDDHAFFEWAQTILAGDWWGRNTYHPYFPWMQDVAPLEEWYRWWGGKEIFHQAPFYPYFLAVLLLLFDGSVQLVMATQMLIGSLQVLIVYGVAARLFDQRVGLVAAGITALYGPFIFYEGTLLRDWLVPIAELLAILALLYAKQRGGPLTWTLAGAALGLALLCKASAVLLVLAAFTSLIYEHWGAWRKACQVLAPLVLGIMLSLSPLLVRNVVVGAPTFSISNRAVEALVHGNAPAWLSMKKSAFRTSQGQLSEAARATLEYNRGGYGTLLENKARMFVSAYETPNNTSYYYGMSQSSLLRWMLGYGFVFPLGLAGVILSMRTWRHHLLLLLYGLSGLGVMALTSPIARYRLVILPVFIVFGAFTLVHLVRALRARRTGPVLGILGLVFGSVFIQQIAGTRPKGPVPYIDYPATALAYERRGDLRGAALEAARAYEAAISDGSISAAHEAAAMEGDFRLKWARQLLREGKPNLAAAQVNLAATAYTKHPNLPIAFMNLGILYAELGETAQAKHALERFLKASPEHARARAAKQLLARLAPSIRANQAEADQGAQPTGHSTARP